ncbi:MAG: hypothetical protein HC830_08845 [Bacteroidetes bacterium]|nr:hypothetical protein [Bacteroidota bacterium]
MLKRITVFCLLFLFHTLVYAQHEPYCFDLESASAFDSLAGNPLSRAFSGVKAVKLVYRLADEKLYFIQSKRYPLHYNFCRDIFGAGDLPDFNRYNYSAHPGRSYILATLNFFSEAQLYTLEFSPADDLDSVIAENMYQVVREHFFDTAHLFCS